ncbi:hypothetical protein [Henriciella litoralis]|uniref:hypothetical protein n=1 Tax=Henriciella litoralis TaxID=568102 RepID=UPI00111C4392|nr:hypothetical protein [Henriciella litoralis]
MRLARLMDATLFGIVFAALSGVLATALTVPRASGEKGAAERPAQSVTIDGEAWDLVGFDETCYARVPAVIEHYARFPLHSMDYVPFPGRMLVNASSDCWIELELLGVSDLSAIFRVTPDFKVVDKRTLSWWGNRVGAYPDQPYDQ